MKKLVSSVLIIAMLAGCASYRPVVDTKGIDQSRYETDLKECQDLATQVNAGGEAAAGALMGAIFGALLGAAVGGRDMAGYGAGIGAVSGGGAGTATGMTGQIQVIKNCMIGRGYRVLR